MHRVTVWLLVGITVVTAGCGTVWRTHTTVVKRNQSVTYNRHTWTDGSGTRRTIERWRTDGRVYVARIAENGTVIGVENGTGSPGTELGTSDGYAGMLPRILKQLNASDVTTVSRDGRQLYRIETPEPKALPPSENVSFVGHVTPDGVFNGYRLAYRVERRDTRVDVTVRTTFEDVGSAVVSRPTWMERAPD